MEGRTRYAQRGSSHSVPATTSNATTEAASQRGQRQIISLDSDDSNGSASPPQPHQPVASSSSHPAPIPNSNQSIKSGRATTKEKAGSKRRAAIDLTADDQADVHQVQQPSKSRRLRKPTQHIGNKRHKSTSSAETSSAAAASSSSSLQAVPSNPDFEDDLTCPICYELFLGPMSLPCGHVFCGGCLTEWLEKTKECPACRDPTYTKPSRALLVETMTEKLVKHQAAVMENEGDKKGSKALIATRAKRVKAIETARMARARARQQEERDVGDVALSIFLVPESFAKKELNSLGALRIMPDRQASRRAAQQAAAADLEAHSLGAGTPFTFPFDDRLIEGGTTNLADAGIHMANMYRRRQLEAAAARTGQASRGRRGGRPFWV